MIVIKIGSWRTRHHNSNTRRPLHHLRVSIILNNLWFSSLLFIYLICFFIFLTVLKILSGCNSSAKSECYNIQCNRRGRISVFYNGFSFCLLIWLTLFVTSRLSSDLYLPMAGRAIFALDLIWNGLQLTVIVFLMVVHNFLLSLHSILSYLHNLSGYLNFPILL